MRRRRITKNPFGSRDPLRPRIASLDDEPPVSPGKALTLSSSSTVSSGIQENPVLEHNVGVNLPSLLQDTSNGAPRSTHPSFNSSIYQPICNWTTGSTSINIKGSDVAVFDSKAIQPTLAPAHRENPLPRSVLASIMEYPDLLDVLMLNCPDFQTLLALVTSCKTAKRVFEKRPIGIIKEMLKTMPQELQDLTIALIGINGRDISTSRSIKRHMKIWLGMKPKPLMGRLRERPIEIVRKLARSFNAIDFFIRVIPKNCESNFEDYKTVLVSRVGLNHADIASLASNHPLLQQTEWSDIPDDTEWEVPSLPPPGSGPQTISLPLNDKELYRLKRALLRYELFCAIFYLGPDRHFDARRYPPLFRLVPEKCKRRAFYKDQVTFFEKYVNPWEIGELAVVSHFMFDLVRNAYFRKYMLLRYRDAQNRVLCHWNHGRNRHDDHEEMVDEFDNHVVWFASQGLTLLRKIYNDRKEGYDALVEKHGRPRYRNAQLFVPFEKCANRRVYDYHDPYASWTPRQRWPDSQGMEQPSKGWVAQSPASEDQWWEDAYWGNKWIRKIGYFIWDRD